MGRTVLNHAHRLAAGLLAVSFAAGANLSWNLDARAQSGDELPAPEEPWLAQPGDWAADFNQAQIACYQGSMSACDAIWLSNRVLLDSFLHQYGRSCGGRVDPRALRRANLSCTEAFPGHE
jgi:hypothetical protein